MWYLDLSHSWKIEQKLRSSSLSEKLHSCPKKKGFAKISHNKKREKSTFIRDRIRTCNLSVRSRTRYPLRHTDD